MQNHRMAGILLSSIAGLAAANGGVWDSTHRASGDALVPTQRLSLQHETLNLQLRASDYQVQVTYHVADQKPHQAETWLFFPLICHAEWQNRDSTEEEKRQSLQSCLAQFKVSADQKPLESHLLSPAEVAARPQLQAVADRINRRAVQQTNAEVDTLEPSQYVFFATKLPHGQPIHTLTVHYQARYSQSAGGTSKSPMTHYDLANLIYDFSPAALWGRHIRQLDIHLDSTQMRSPLQYDAKHWPFHFQGSVGTLSLSRPQLAKLPPLRLYTDNAGYMNYTDFMQTLRKGDVAYRFTVKKATPSREHHDIRAAFDRNPNTFWCWRGHKATLQAQLQPLIIATDTSSSPEQFYSYVLRLNALGLLNGATQNQQTFARYGLARQISVLPESSEPQPSQTLPLPRWRAPLDQYHSQWLVEDLFPRVDSPNDTQPLETLSAVQSARKTLQMQTYTIQIKAVHPRKGSNESCIAELYPVYLD